MDSMILANAASVLVMTLAEVMECYFHLRIFHNSEHHVEGSLAVL